MYPESFWLPGTGVQRGSLALADGDPLTPNWPSVDHAYRLDSEERQVRSAEKTRTPLALLFQRSALFCAHSLRSCFKGAPCLRTPLALLFQRSTPFWALMPSVDHAYKLDSEERQVRSAEKTRANSLRSCYKGAPCFALSCPVRMISAHCALCTCFPNAMHLHCKKG